MRFNTKRSVDVTCESLKDSLAWFFLAFAPAAATSGSGLTQQRTGIGKPNMVD
jgi:hypothetical protein